MPFGMFPCCCAQFICLHSFHHFIAGDDQRPAFGLARYMAKFYRKPWTFGTPRVQMNSFRPRELSASSLPASARQMVLFISNLFIYAELIEHTESVASYRLFRGDRFPCAGPYRSTTIWTQQARCWTTR